MATDSPATAPGLAIHIVQFRYKGETSDEDRGLLARRFQEMTHTCLSETTGKPYIASLVAGSNVTRERDHDKCYDHAFVVAFHSEADLDYYLDTDPVHKDFKTFVRPFVADAAVMDFVDGSFRPKAA